MRDLVGRKELSWSQLCSSRSHLRSTAHSHTQLCPCSPSFPLRVSPVSDDQILKLVERKKMGSIINEDSWEGSDYYIIECSWASLPFNGDTHLLIFLQFVLIYWLIHGILSGLLQEEDDLTQWWLTRIGPHLGLMAHNQFLVTLPSCLPTFIICIVIKFSKDLFLWVISRCCCSSIHLLVPFLFAC